MSNPNIIPDYLDLLDLSYDVAQSIKGKKTKDYKMIDCQQLALKLYMHAASIYELRQGTKAPVPRSATGGTNFYDFASVAVIARATIETYLSLFEVFFESISDDEREFRYQLWLLSGFVIREKYEIKDPSFIDKVKESRELLSEIRKRIQNTNYFSKLSVGQKRDVLKGKRIIRDWGEIAKAANIKKEMLMKIYSYYSGFAHADGLSGTQIVTAKTREDQIAMQEVNMISVMMIMSKMIIDYYNKFPESRVACEKKMGSFNKAIKWCSAASNS